MSNENQNETIPKFDDAQRAYIQRILAESHGKELKIGTELQTAEQRAEQYRANGDFLGLKADREAKHALIEKHGAAGYAEVQRKHLAAENSRKADERRIKIEENKKRLGIR